MKTGFAINPIRPAKCTRCGMQVDKGVGLGEAENRPPVENSVTLCQSCGHMMFIEPDPDHPEYWILREPTRHELRSVQNSDTWRDILKAKGFILFSLLCGQHPNCKDKQGIDPSLIERDPQINDDDFPLMASLLPGYDILDILELVKRYGEEEWFNIIFHMQPPLAGTRLFTTKMHYENYRPGLDGDEKFHFYWFEWGDLKWGLMSIPYDHRHIAYRVAEEAGLELVNNSPVSMDGQKKEVFPIRQVFMLKHMANSKFKCDENNGSSYKWARDDEDQDVNVIFRDYEDFLRTSPDLMKALTERKNVALIAK